ncbi:MAG: valine--tRNA ligase [Spartobacteria bacterium]|nr:valine--tRNA ligase [Spartobacteria bacterium]
MSELPKNIDTGTIEEKWYRHWIEQGYFHGDASKGGEPYCVVIPPPNVTGILHMGHALNDTIQDVLVRSERMKGKNVVWVPGTDHAGIATQNVVERKMAKEGLTRDDIGRDKFIENVWEWKEEYGGTIINQLKKLGCSCDWERERFTMDEGLSNAVKEVFVRLYDKGLIYRGSYIINWCPRCQTALSDEESEHQQKDGKIYYVRYPMKGGKRKDDIIVATTRPETMLGDTAVAINPRDKRYEHLKGKTVVLPLLNREIPVIEDDYVDPEFGTGIVKITPAHDPNDFEIGLRHNLPQINVMNDDASMNEEAGAYAGMDRFECRKRILEDLKSLNLLEKIEDHQNAVGHCYRCNTMVEPRLSPQWFVKMKPLAEPALRAVRNNEIRFIPDRWTKVYTEWMENIRDWCISRQIWWGHRIPVFYCDACNHQWAARDVPTVCPECQSSNVRQDEDVLDTWFSSWLWPFSVFGWPDKSEDLAFYYPTKTLVTASEIIFFWVARMVMSGMEFMGDIPFSDVYIHGTVRDDSGRKMSKSLGNSIDPLTIIEKFSADALRFSLIMLTATGQDLYLSDDKFEIGRNFATKIWNAARFMQMKLGDAPMQDGFDKPVFRKEYLRSDDAHIISKLNSTIAQVNENLRRYRFNDVAKSLHEFVWHQFCDWYVESTKSAFNGEDAERLAEVGKVMHYVFSSAIRLLHPIMPFVTEELWQAMGYNALSESIMIAPWPVAFEYEEMTDIGITSSIVQYVDAKHDLIRIGRTLMADYNVKNTDVDFILKPSNENQAANALDDNASIVALLRVSSMTIDAAFEPGKPMPSALTQLGTLYMPLDGIVDVQAEMEKLKAELAKINGDLISVSKKLENMDFINKAPAKVVAIQENRKKELLEKADKVSKRISAFSES